LHERQVWRLHELYHGSRRGAPFRLDNRMNSSEGSTEAVGFNQEYTESKQQHPSLQCSAIPRSDCLLRRHGRSSFGRVRSTRRSITRFTVSGLVSQNRTGCSLPLCFSSTSI
jgi:hypothetical protein